MKYSYRRNLLSDYSAYPIVTPLGWDVNGGLLNTVKGNVYWGSDSDYIWVITSTGSTDTVADTEAATVSPGEEYTAGVWVIPADRAATVTISIVWLNSVSAPVGTPASQIWNTPSGNLQRRASVYGTAPIGASKALVRVSVTNGAAGDETYMDGTYLGLQSSQIWEQSMLTFGEVYCEPTGAESLWSAAGGTLVRDESAYVPDEAHADGATMLKAIPDGVAPVLTVWPTRELPVTPGTEYSFGTRVVIRQNSDPLAVINARVRAEWLGEAGEVLSSSEGDYGTSTSADVWVYTVRELVVLAPEGAVSVRVLVDVDPTASTATGYYMHGWRVVPATPLYTLSTDEDAGAVILTIPAYPWRDTDRLTIWRVHADGSQHPLRAWHGDVNGDEHWSSQTETFEDYEAPPGVEIRYRIITYSDTTEEHYDTTTHKITAPSLPDPSYVWLKSPGLPVLNTKAVMQSPPAWSYASRSASHPIVGRSEPLIIFAPRDGRVGTLSVLTWTYADEQAVLALLKSGSSLLLHAAPGYGIEGGMHLSVGDVTTSPVSPDGREETRIWTLAVSEVSRPKGRLQGSRLRTWDTLADPFYSSQPDWASLLNDFSSWANVLVGITGGGYDDDAPDVA
ncbi:hypothetical protein LHJ74_30715 [Streptomyces sp. N2-109]|uniref:Minor tail protein n=1 Tax=Streptomyces gossypii TaxID=2883101 RepID=A0ABT2K3M7_9ACTN|nr:hypothetical protein [Streptomyces gossypii]MCT2594229.1 hypothetical protein [Streptomyces gossypii]